MIRLPIACLLGPSSGRKQLEAWRRFNGESLLEVEQSPGSVIAWYGDTGGAEDRLRSLVAVERSCCGFVDWTVDRTDGRLRLTVSGQPESVSALVFLADAEAR